MKNIEVKFTKNIITAFFVLLLSSLSLLSVFSIQNVGAEVNIKKNICEGATDLTLDSSPGGCGPAEGGGSAQRSVNNLIRAGINIFSIIVGIVAVIMIIYGGLKFITSGGDSGRVSSAKQTIIYAIIGLIIVALAQFIVKFILSQTPR